MSGDKSGDGSGTDAPDFSELGTGEEVVGDLTTRSVQVMRRVDIPDKYMDHLGLDQGDKVMVECRDDEIAITEAKVQRVKGND